MEDDKPISLSSEDRLHRKTFVKNKFFCYKEIFYIAFIKEIMSSIFSSSIINMKNILLALVVSQCYVCASAQNKDSMNNAFALQESIIGSHLSFSVSPFLPGNVKITNTSDQYIYKPFVSIGLEIGINYRFNLGKGYTLVAGLHEGNYKRSFRFITTKNKFNPQLQNDVFLSEKTREENILTDYFASLPVLLEKQWENKKNNLWSIFAGMNVRRYWLKAFNDEWWALNDVSGGGTVVLHKKLLERNDNKLLFNFNFGGGYSIFLKNYDFLRFGISVNYSPDHLLQYKYTVPFAAQPQPGGTYTVNMSYVAINVEYTITGTKVKLRKMQN